MNSGEKVQVAFTVLTAIILAIQGYILYQTETTERVTNRAFVFASHPEWSPLLLDGHIIGWQIAPQWQNSELTATSNLDIESWCQTPKEAATEPWYDPEHPDALNNNGNFLLLGPRQTLPGVVCWINLENLTQVQKGNKHMYIATVATYGDRFDTTPSHRSEYCVEVSRIVGSLTDPKSEPSISYKRCSSGHICADEECTNESRARQAGKHKRKSVEIGFLPSESIA